MFTDLDLTLQQLLVRFVPLEPSEVDVSFEIPDRDWSGRLSRPTVNLFLYSVLENQKLRPTGWSVQHNGEQKAATRQKPPLRFDAFYQVTAWARAWEDQHRLLWRVLAALARHPTLPRDILIGGLRDQSLPIVTQVAQPEHQPGNLGDLWGALDNRIRPALTCVVTLALDPQLALESPLVLHAPRINLVHTNPDEAENGFVVRGRVRDRSAPSVAISGALVLLADTGQRVLTDADGRFSISGAPRGHTTFIVRAEGRSETTWSTSIPLSSALDLSI